MSKTTASGVPLVPSDVLRSFVDLLRQFPPIVDACGGPILDVRLVLDANAIMQDVLHAAKAGDPHMRPMVEELMDCGVLRCLAPDSVKAEVERHLPRLAEGLDGERRARAVAVWARYQSKIEWIDAAAYAPGVDRFPVLAARDPDDVPVAAVFHVHGADAIVTDDRDLLDCPEVAAISRKLVQTVRDYARAKAVAMTATTLPSLAITGVLVFAVEVFAAIPDRWKLVAILLVVAIAVAAYFIMSAETRSSIRTALANWLDWTTQAMPSVEVAAEHEAAIVHALPSCTGRAPNAAEETTAPSATASVLAPTEAPPLHARPKPRAPRAGSRKPRPSR